MRRRQLPTLWLMTDERIETPRLLRAAGRLPRGSGIVFRHYRTEAAERRALFDRLRRIARRRGLLLFLAGEEVEALRWGADGFHARTGKSRRLPMSVPAHNLMELRQAEARGAAFVFLSPLFPTRSHPGAPALGMARFAAVARRAKLPVMALGGVALRHRTMLRTLGATGFGAIDALS